MKKTLSFLTYMLVFVIAFIFMNGCKEHTDEKGYLKKVVKNLNQIKTATYISTLAAYSPYDTMPVYMVDHYHKEYVTPEDTFVGASYVQLLKEDTTRMYFCYDGKMRARVHWDEKTMEIDSFQNNKLPIRPVWAPFFTRAKTLINYVLETKDSLTIETKDFGDSVQYSFSIYDTVVEFIGTRIIYPPSQYGSHKGEISKYAIWIHKSDGLPYHITRDLPHSKDVEICSNVRFNEGDYRDFVASDYFPDYPLRKKGQVKEKNDLEGKLAPDWILKDGNNNPVALKELKSKILLIKFTGIGCGPCQASIPFLKGLVNEYKNKDFELVSLETWSSNINTLKRYGDKNELNYKFLLSTKDITNSYQIQSVPIFFLLDENRVIRKVFSGYGKDTTDKQIRGAINEMM